MRLDIPKWVYVIPALIRSDIKDNGDAIGDLETDIDTNKVDIQTNSKNITDNEEDIGENEEAIIDNYDEIGINREKIENLTISIEEKIEMHAELIANNTNATKENEMMIQQNKDDIHTNLGQIIDLLDLNPRSKILAQMVYSENILVMEISQLLLSHKFCNRLYTKIFVYTAHIYNRTMTFFKTKMF